MNYLVSIQGNTRIRYTCSCEVLEILTRILLSSVRPCHKSIWLLGFITEVHLLQLHCPTCCCTWFSVLSIGRTNWCHYNCRLRLQSNDISLVYSLLRCSQFAPVVCRVSRLSLSLDSRWFSHSHSSNFWRETWTNDCKNPLHVSLRGTGSPFWNECTWYVKKSTDPLKNSFEQFHQVR